MNNFLSPKILFKRFLVLAFVLMFSFFMVQNSYAESCDSTVQGYKDWLQKSLPQGDYRALISTMVSNTKEINFGLSKVLSDPITTYFRSGLKIGGKFSLVFIAKGDALFNDREWFDSCNTNQVPCHHWNPFDPYDADEWTIYFSHTNPEVMVIIKPDETISIPLECSNGFLIGTHTEYKAFGQFQIPVNVSKYMMSINGVEHKQPR